MLKKGSGCGIQGLSRWPSARQRPGLGATRLVTMTQPAISTARSSGRPDPARAVEGRKVGGPRQRAAWQGDIGSARIVLERVAETGDAQASLALAETCDPLVLRKWSAYGTLAMQQRHSNSTRKPEPAASTKRKRDSMRYIGYVPS